MIKSITIMLLLASFASQACDSQLIPQHADNGSITLKMANAELSEFVLELNQTLHKTSELQSSDLSPTTLVNQIDCYLNKLSGNGTWSEMIAPFQSSLTALGRELISATDQQQTRTAIRQINQRVARDAGTGFVVFPAPDQSTTVIDLYQQILAKSCNSNAPNPACTNALNLTKTLWWIAGEYRRMADKFNQQDKLASLKFNQQLDRQWRSYKDDTIKLWPHEVTVNSLIYKPSKRGLSAPPNYKILSLRPSLGLTYLSDQNTHLQPTLNIDLLGVYWWRYGEDAKAKPGRGVSASLIWDGDDSALGVSYHHSPKWSLTLANDNENDLVISMSFQLAFYLLR